MDYYKNRVIDIVTSIYSEKLAKATGLSFHVETKEVIGRWVYGCYEGKTTADYNGNVTVNVVCDTKGYYDKPVVHFSAKTWVELSGFMVMVENAEWKLYLADRDGAEVFER